MARMTTECILQQIVRDMFDRPLMSNLARPHFVERLVQQALGSDWRHVGGEWSGWDLEHMSSFARIEIKQSAKRQTWGNRPGRLGKPTKPIFEIGERSGYFADGGARWVISQGRPADLYIFAWHDRYDPEDAVDHRDPKQWNFYLLPEKELPKNQKTISLRKLRKLGATAFSYHDLRNSMSNQLADLRPFKSENEAVTRRSVLTRRRSTHRASRIRP